MQIKRLCKRAGSAGGLSLPNDIIFEVLLRLPARALCQFRCVCKAWHALISDPTFAAAQRCRASGPFIVAVFGSAPEHELRLLDKAGNVLRVFDVRGGTALLAPTRLDLIFIHRAELGAMIIDPESGCDFTIVQTNDLSPPARSSTAMRVIDYSFGRAAGSGDYKVLRLVTSSCRNECRLWSEVIRIMDSGGAEPTWRKRPWGPFYDTRFSCEDKATVNGILYFMPHKSYHSTYAYARDHIAAFDLASEDWRPETIKCPPLEGNWNDTCHIALTDLKGTLCVVENIRLIATLGGHYVNVWLLMDANKSIWMKEYRVQMPGGFLLSTKPLDVLGDGKILLLLNASSKAGNVVRYILQFYNSSTKDFTDFMVMEPGFNGTMTFYPGSLLC